MLCSAIAFALLKQVMPDSTVSAGPINDEKQATFIGHLISTFVQTVVVIFATGPIKVWLDIKRGKTSLTDI